MACITTHPCRHRSALLPGMGMSVGQVICWRMMLGVVVSKVGSAAVPVEAELGLGLPAAEPVEAEPNHLSASLDDCVIEEAGSRGVVCLDWGGRLGPSHFKESMAERDHLTCGMVEGARFCFGCGCNDIFNDM